MAKSAHIFVRVTDDRKKEINKIAEQLKFATLSDFLNFLLEKFISERKK
jgi:antitoxin component of RelBE/YafQ-DinJ toxin-antitoxin module